MRKGYTISLHRSLADLEKSNAYRWLAKPALERCCGKYLASIRRVVARENGVVERTIPIEFENLEAAIAAFDSADYQVALMVLDSIANRDIRLFEGA